MIPKEAIELALKGGWKEGKYRLIEVLGRMVCMQYISKIAPEQPYISWHFENVALDPTFWQALGKVLGWEHEYMCVNWGREEIYSVPLWQFYADKLYDLILTNQDTTEFWQQLLAQPKEKGE